MNDSIKPIFLHPQQNVFKFSSGITISSDFDSGNLAQCTETSPNNFDCYINGDGLPYSQVGYVKTWFYFNVKGA